MHKIYTNTPDNFKYIDQYKEVLQQIVTNKTDLLWKNYVDFNFAEQSALSVGLEGDEVKVISSIIHKPIWPNGVYRLLNRYAVVKDYRDTMTKTHHGEGHNIAQIMLDNQIKYLKQNINYNFYFASRQKNKRFLDYWIKKFNQDYNYELAISDKRYWICDSTKFNCCQVLIYDPQHKIPFLSETEKQ